MSVLGEILATDPLFKILRNGLLWHFTKASSYRQIVANGNILPVLPGQQNRWDSRRHACQTFGAVCLFDFTTPSEADVLLAAVTWEKFLVLERPLTVLIGLDGTRLPGKLIRYPENRDLSPSDSCAPIPDVEVCHVGPIPVMAFTTHILICAADPRVFKCVVDLSENVLEQTVQEFGVTVAAATERMRAELAAPSLSSQQKIAEAKLRVAKMRKQSPP